MQNGCLWVKQRERGIGDRNKRKRINKIREMPDLDL